MFRRNKDDNGGAGDSAASRPPAEDISAPPLKPFSRKGSHAPAKPPATATFAGEAARRVTPIPTVPRRIERSRVGESDSKRLFVGRDIRLTGEITSCERLVVEGQVEATLSNARAIEVAPTGFFRGSATVEEADISGRFEGELIATDKLTLRATGQISGSIRYGRIVIESGGEISGDMQTLDQARVQGPAGAKPGPSKSEP